MINISIEEKIQYFALYYGQNIVRSGLPEQSGYLSKVSYDKFQIVHLIINSRLELNSIGNITQDEIEELHLDYKNRDEIRKELSMFGFGGFFDGISCTDLDLLRAKGYATPFKNYNIKDLIDNYIINLKDYE